MNDEETLAIAEAIAQPLGEAIVIFIAVVNALRKQPGFDDYRFCQEIQVLLAREDWSEMQREALSSLLDNSK